MKGRGNKAIQKKKDGNEDLALAFDGQRNGGNEITREKIRIGKILL
jgi:hypothetical protein